MLKRISVLLLAALMLFGAGCSGGAPQGETPQSSQNTEAAEGTAAAAAEATQAPDRTQSAAEDKFYRINGGSTYSSNGNCLIETDDAVYMTVLKKNVFADGDFHDANYILFSDKEYMDWMPLCGKPDCMHDSLDCNAFFEYYRCRTMWLYGDHIYYFVESDAMAMPKLMRMKLDGTDHEIMYPGGGISLYPQGVMSCGGGYDMAFHDKYAFVFFSLNYSFENQDEDGSELEEHRDRRCFMLDLDDPSEPGELVFTNEEGEQVKYFNITAGRGDKIYSIENNFDYDRETGETTYYNSSLYVYDLTAQTVRKLSDLPIMADLGDGWIEDGKLWCVGYDAAEMDKLVFPDEGSVYIEEFEHQRRMIVAVDIETGETEVVNTAFREDAPWFAVFAGYVFGAVKDWQDGELEPGCYIYDLSGELVDFVPQREDAHNIMICYIVGDLVFGAVGTNDIKDMKTIDFLNYNGPKWYFRLSEIGSGDICWHDWQP